METFALYRSKERRRKKVEMLKYPQEDALLLATLKEKVVDGKVVILTLWDWEVMNIGKLTRSQKTEFLADTYNKRLSFAR